MTDFHLPSDIPPENFVFREQQWWAKTIYGNTYFQGLASDSIGSIVKADILLISLKTNEFIPVSIYDEHQNGLPVLEFYNKNRDDFFPLIVNGIQHPISYSEAKALENVLVRLEHDDLVDIKGIKVFLGYLENPKITPIPALDFISHKFDLNLTDEPLTDTGEKLLNSLKQLRDCRNTGVYHGRNVKKSFEKMCSILLPYGYTTKEDIEEVKDLAQQYQYNELSAAQFEHKIFGYYGVKNRIHNRIRKAIKTPEFKNLVGNPMIINNYMELM